MGGVQGLAKDNMQTNPRLILQIVKLCIIYMYIKGSIMEPVQGISVDFFGLHCGIRIQSGFYMRISRVGVRDFCLVVDS